jgi:hypothetical protein
LVKGVLEKTQASENTIFSGFAKSRGEKEFVAPCKAYKDILRVPQFKALSPTLYFGIDCIAEIGFIF